LNSASLSGEIGPSHDSAERRLSAGLFAGSDPEPFLAGVRAISVPRFPNSSRYYFFFGNS